MTACRCRPTHSHRAAGRNATTRRPRSWRRHRAPATYTDRRIGAGSDQRAAGRASLRAHRPRLGGPRDVGEPRPDATARRPSRPAARPRVRSPHRRRPRPWPCPMTSWRPTCPSVPAIDDHQSSQAHLIRVSTLSGRGSSPYPAGYTVTAGGGASIEGARFPVAFRPPAFASRIILRPPQARPPSRSAHQVEPPGLRRGCHVPHETDTTGEGALCPRGRWCAPARPSSPGRHLPPHSDRPLPPAETTHRARVLMTRRQRGFTRFTRPVFPSL